MRYFIAVIFVGVLLSGCAGYDLTPETTVQSTTLSRNAEACISIPEDGQYGDHTYKGSGQALAESVNRAFAPYLQTTLLKPGLEGQAATLAQSKHEGCEYLLLPQILHWEDRATEWSGKPDRIAVKLSVLSTDSGEVLDAAIFHAKSSFWTLGGDHPQDLVYQPLKEYAAKLFP
ncbi:MAG: DUF4823 domain-containing protein [Gammaproteobacteria bacterium]